MHSLPICYVTPKHMGPVMHSLRILLPLNLEFSGWTLFDAIYESATPKLGIIECSSWTLLCAVYYASVTPKCCRWTLLCTVYASATPTKCSVQLDPVMHSLRIGICYA